MSMYCWIGGEEDLPFKRCYEEVEYERLLERLKKSKSKLAIKILYLLLSS